MMFMSAKNPTGEAIGGRGKGALSNPGFTPPFPVRAILTRSARPTPTLKLVSQTSLRRTGIDFQD
jgi:hypothetical protein